VALLHLRALSNHQSSFVSLAQGHGFELAECRIQHRAVCYRV
jgi:hypothetical protein